MMNTRPIENENDSIDRLAPARRPERRVVMYQSWHDLLFLHWPIEPDALRRLLPQGFGLELDLYQGLAYAALVPFTMTGVRPAGLPSVPWVSDFAETNVRTYVVHPEAGPGVWFFSLEAACRLAVVAARTFFALPYYRARMESVPESDGSIRYRSQRTSDPTVGCRVRYAPDGPPAPAQPGSLEHFLVERYILFAARGGTLRSGRVHHPPYPIQPARAELSDETLLKAAGIERPDVPPLMHYVRRVDVEVFGLERVAHRQPSIGL